MKLEIRALLPLGLLCLLAPFASASPQSNSWDVTPADILVDQEEIYEGLFGDPWDIGTAQYWLNAPRYAGQLGTFQGHNELGLSFDYVVKSADVVDYHALDLPRSLLLDLDQRAFAMTRVEGSILTALASFEITATVLSYVNAQGLDQTDFLVGTHADTSTNAIAAWQAANPGEAFQLGTFKVIPVCRTVEWGGCIASTPECDACWDQLQDRIADLQADYDAERDRLDAELGTAQTDHTACTSYADRNLIDAQDYATQDFLSNMNSCNNSGGSNQEILACIATAAAVLEAGLANNEVDHTAAIQDCDNQLALAESQYRADLQNLNANYERGMAVAEQEYEDCLEANNCNVPCTATICILIVVWCPQ